MSDIFNAHINEETNEGQTVKEHSENTALLCRQFAIPILKDFMYAMGLLHDVGKYQLSFQRRLKGENIRVEHSTCGAIVAKDLYPNVLALLMEYCIAGHHSGIPDGGYINDTPDLSTLNGRMRRVFEDFSTYKQEIFVPEINTEKVIGFLLQDCKNKTDLVVDKFTFLTRYCFSCLTDADSLDTAHFCSGETIRPLNADFKACLKKVNKKLTSFVSTTDLQKTRALLQQQVFEKANTDAEIYLMNMPTGSGKTLCSVKFALERALKHNRKRIIYIIPYNSIIDQTVSVLEDIFEDSAEILRHQSTFSYDDEDYTEDYKKAAKSASENWNVNSIIVTTAVQFFESIYANKRGKLRKLHNMAESILIFDEAHLMPQDYLQPCLRAIAHITRNLNSEAVFLTATMPDFPKLIHQYALDNSKIVDLIEDTSMFCKFQKCSYQYIGEMNSREILSKSGLYPSSLIIVNKRMTARKLYNECIGKKFHLSTYMTAVDRKRVIDEIRFELTKLEKDFPDFLNVPEDRRITIISTSLIEAGIDLDIFTVFRELSGLDSILQAGGRCNREGKRNNAEVYIFEFAEDKKTAQNIKNNLTRGIIDKYENISSLQSIKEYYNRLLFMKKEDIQQHTITKECNHIASIPFSKYANEFELIDTKTVSVVVPRDNSSQEIIDSLKFTGGSVTAGRKLQKYTCSVYQNELNDLIRQHVVSNFGTEISCLTNLDYYDEEIGILFEGKDYFI